MSDYSFDFRRAGLDVLNIEQDAIAQLKNGN
jgi:hypothetical protein